MSPKTFLEYKDVIHRRTPMVRLFSKMEELVYIIDLLTAIVFNMPSNRYRIYYT